MNTLRPATADASLTAVVVAHSPIYYVDGADDSLDRPAHVRAGSSLALVPGGIALVQDDANFIAVVDPVEARARPITLPAGPEGRRQFDDRRGNKKHKLDLEACVAVEADGEAILVALGSGSKRRREQVALVRDWSSDTPEVTMVHAPRLYDVLRRERAFAGSRLNIEGAVHLGDRLRLFGRGNGGPRGGVQPVNATCDLDWPTLFAHLRAPDRSSPPAPTNIVGYELGALDGVPLSFTDATVRGKAILYTAAAEESPDVTLDGPVTGSAIGVIDAAGRVRWTQLVEPSGARFAGKVEGLVVAPDAPDRLYVVVDSDDPDAASVLCTVELRGDWGA